MTNWNVIQELRELQNQFRAPELSQACCAIDVQDDRIQVLTFGLPLDEPEETQAFIQSGLPIDVSMRLFSLFDRAGAALKHIPRFGVVAERWHEWILQNGDRGDMRWAAFLTTGPRLFFVEGIRASGRRIKDVADVSANAIDGLISVVLESQSPPPKPQTTPRKRKPRMKVEDVEQYWQVVRESGNRLEIEFLLSESNDAVAKKIGCARNTLAKSDFGKNRRRWFNEFNRENR